MTDYRRDDPRDKTPPQPGATIRSERDLQARLRRVVREYARPDETEWDLELKFRRAYEGGQAIPRCPGAEREARIAWGFAPKPAHRTPIPGEPLKDAIQRQLGPWERREARLRACIRETRRRQQAKTGWRLLIAKATHLAALHGAYIRRRADVAGRLSLELTNCIDERRRDRVRGILAAVEAMSGETCRRCGRPGDPVRLKSGDRSTRCGQCRQAGDQVLPRPSWRKPGSDHVDVPGLPLVEDLVGLKDLEALMEPSCPAVENEGWPARAVHHPDGAVSHVDNPGWDHLIRAVLGLLLPTESADPPWRLGRLYDRAWVGLTLLHAGPAASEFHEGISEALLEIADRSCTDCGRIDILLRHHRATPECPRCSREMPPLPARSRRRARAEGRTMPEL